MRVKASSAVPLTNAVTQFWDGRFYPTYNVESSAIVDLDIAPQQRHGSVSERTSSDTRTIAFIPENGHGHEPLQSIDPNLPRPPSHGQPPPFNDPAILSYTKPTAIANKIIVTSGPVVQPQVLSPVMIADSVRLSPSSVSERSQGMQRLRGSLSNIPATGAFPKRQQTRERRDSSATATLTEPFDHMALNGDPGLSDLPGSPDERATIQENLQASIPNKSNAKRNRRGGNRKARDIASQTAPGVIDLRVLNPTPPAAKKPSGKGKGWRQTPLVEEVSIAKQAPAEGRFKHRSRKSILEDANGWATEDATDIQDLGDFDFESNLSKFDKRRVFDDIRKVDNTADNERLVSFNRRARPGTNGGKNLHYTENVLESPELTRNIWKSEAGETEDEAHEDHYSSGRGSRRGTSKRPLQSRKGSMLPTSSLARGISRMESPRPAGKLSAPVSPANGSVRPLEGSLRLESSNKPCSSVSPLQMLEVEQLCTSELGISEEILAENAGRGIAETALTWPLKSLPSPNVLFLVGNHKSGARAVAAARHLRNRGMRVLLCVIGGEREEMLLESLRRQLDIYKRNGGWVVKWDELQTKLSAASALPPDLIIEALLGMHVAFDELRTDDQAIAFEMMRWAGRSSIPILSVDVPSGLDASSGEVTHVDSVPLILPSTYVVCLGAPKTGVLHALAADEAGSHHWQLIAVDIGISRIAWRKYGSRRRHGVDFGSSWIVPLKFVAESGIA